MNAVKCPGCEPQWITKGNVIAYMIMHPDEFTGLKVPNFTMPSLNGVAPETVVAFMLNEDDWFIEDEEGYCPCCGD